MASTVLSSVPPEAEPSSSASAPEATKLVREVSRLPDVEQDLKALALAVLGESLADGRLSLGVDLARRDSEVVTQAFGDRWLDAGTELALWVPSYVEPAEHNLIINALHPRLAEVALVTERDPFEFDPRLA